MQQLVAPVRAEIEIRKSRFIALLYPVGSRDEAMRLLAGARSDWPDARHYCAVLLTPGDSMLNDDGEPSGTAARPMYNVLQHKQIGNVLAIVVRYFGGVKLGAGGLVRAYTQAVNEALKDARFVECIEFENVAVAIPFSREARLRHLCEEAGIEPGPVSYDSAHAVFTLRIPANERRERLEAIRSGLSGQLRLIGD
ncbi:IMPACT family protein [Paludibacterium paludis]|nr:YigZ family protein [Paludibacterium paludis]